MNAAMFKSLEFRAGIVSVLILVFVLAVWHAFTLPNAPAPAPALAPATAVSAEQAEYDKLMGKTTTASGAVTTTKVTGFPTLSQMGETVAKQLGNPFYDNGPNDKGIAIQLAYSLGRVGLGFLIACVVAIPMGFLIGMSPLLRRAFDPFIQVLKPISPLAWMPLAL